MGEDISVIDLSYNWKNWEFSGGMILPFGKYDQGSRSLSKWNTNEMHTRLDMRMPYISISYNLQWGRQNAELRSSLKLMPTPTAQVQAEDNTNSLIIQQQPPSVIECRGR